MKYLAHVPTEQYGFVSVEVEGEPQDVLRAYDDLKRAFVDTGVGLPSKDWCRFLDCYLGEGKPPEDGMSLWQDMSIEQRHVVNEVKKCLARIKRKNGELDSENEGRAIAEAMADSGPGRGENGDYSGMD